MNKETIEAFQLQLDQFKTKATEETQVTIKALEDKLNNLSKEDKEATAKELEAIKAQMGEVNEFINQQKENKSGAKNAMSVTEKLNKAFEENKEQLLNAGRSVGGSASFEVKAAIDMLISTSIESGIERTEQLPYEKAPSYSPSVWDVLVKTPTNAHTIKWVEKVEIEGSAKMTAEGAEKPKRSFKLVSRKMDVKKLPVYEVASKEILADVDSFKEFMNEDMREAISDELKAQSLKGDGTGENLTGIYTIAKPFVAPTLKVERANVFDVIRLAGAQVAKAGGRPTHFALSIEDAVALDLQKTESGQYILPPFTTQSGTTIKGMTLVEDINLNKGEYLVWDNNKARVRVREELNFSTGYTDKQFIENMTTVLAETRLLVLVKEQNKKCFVKGNLNTDITSIEKPAPAGK